MRIEVLRNLGHGLPPLKEGQTVDVADDVGELLCSRGLAKQLHAVPKPVVAAVPAEPVKAEPPKQGTVEKAEADLKTYIKKAKKSDSE